MHFKVTSKNVILNAVANRAIDVEQVLYITRRRRKAYCRMVTTTTQLWAKYADRYAQFATAFSIIRSGYEFSAPILLGISIPERS